MVISSYQQFYELIKSDALPIVAPLVDCIKSANAICVCKKRQKQNRSNECNQMYIDFINSFGVANIELWKTKTTDDSITFSHNSHHVINVVNLK
jgi:hypothetical protein